MEQETLNKEKTYVHPLVDKSYEIELDSREFSFGVVGDMHLHASTPRSRIDDFPETCIEKLGILRRHLKSLECDYLFLVGDIFHVSKERSDFEYRVIEAFQKFAEDGITVFAIQGNHDLQYDRMDSIAKSSLGILFLTGTIKPFTKVIFKRGIQTDVVVTGLPFPNDIQPVTAFEAYNILCCHKFYNIAADKDAVMKRDLEKYGYNMYVCGHDHMVYDLEKVPTKDGVVSIVRPGSFTRGTAHNYNTNRMVYMDEIKFSSKVEVVRHTLPVKDPKEVFPASATDRVEDPTLKDVSRQLADLVTHLYAENKTGASVYQILDNSPVDVKIKNRIVEYLESHGIFRRDNIVAEQEKEE